LSHYRRLRSKRNWQKKSPKELANMKKAYDAASAFTTIMSNMLDKSIPYEDFEEMNQDMLCWVNLTVEENPTGDGDKNSSDKSSSEDEAPPQKKWRNENQVLNLSSKLVGRNVTMTMMTL
jgi:hypothetical protein